MSILQARLQALIEQTEEQVKKQKERPEAHESLVKKARTPKTPRLTMGSDIYIKLGGADVLFPMGFDEYEVCENRIRLFASNKRVVTVFPTPTEYQCEFLDKGTVSKTSCNSLDDVKSFIMGCV
jgi:hypothetical protein